MPGRRLCRRIRREFGAGLVRVLSRGPRQGSLGYRVGDHGVRPGCGAGRRWRLVALAGDSAGPASARTTTAACGNAGSGSGCRLRRTPAAANCRFRPDRRRGDVCRPGFAGAGATHAGPDRVHIATATEQQILDHVPAAGAPDPTVFRFASDPRILVLDFASLLEQGRMLNRVAALVEKSGLPHDRVLTTSKSTAAIRASGDTVETFYYGHDYGAAR